MRSGGLLYFNTQRISVPTEIVDSMVTLGEPGGDYLDVERWQLCLREARFLASRISNAPTFSKYVDIFLYYFSRILEKGLFQMEVSDVRIAEKMSGQMFEKRLQICNVIVQPCAA